jgi:hypothetical protein
MPWDKGFQAVKTVSQWAPWLLLPWLAMTACLIVTRREWSLDRDRKPKGGGRREMGEAMKEALV